MLDVDEAGADDAAYCASDGAEYGRDGRDVAEAFFDVFSALLNQKSLFHWHNDQSKKTVKTQTCKESVRRVCNLSEYEYEAKCLGEAAEEEDISPIAYKPQINPHANWKFEKNDHLEDNIKSLHLTWLEIKYLLININGT